MTPKNDPANSLIPPQPVILIGRAGNFALHQVTDSELDSLERGSPVSIYLNALIACVTFGGSLAVTLKTADISSDRVFATLAAIIVATVIASIVLSFLWLRERNTIRDIVAEIKSRLPLLGEKFEPYQNDLV